MSLIVPAIAVFLSLFMGCPTICPLQLLHHPNLSLAPVQPHFAPVQEASCSRGPKDLLHPLSPNHFRELSLFGQFPRSTASQGKRQFGRHVKRQFGRDELQVKNCRDTVGSQFLPRGIENLRCLAGPSGFSIENVIPMLKSSIFQSCISRFIFQSMGTPLQQLAQNRESRIARFPKRPGIASISVSRSTTLSGITLP